MGRSSPRTKKVDNKKPEVAGNKEKARAPLKGRRKNDMKTQVAASNKKAPPSEVGKESKQSEVTKKESEPSTAEDPVIPDIPSVMNTPSKRKGTVVSIMAVNKKKSKFEPTIPKQPLRVEGYAFHDNIIGITHRKNDGEDAFNGTIRQKILHEEFHEKNIHAFVTLRDTASGKDDLPLQGENKYNKIMFLNINTEVYENANDAHQHVLDKVTTVHDVSIICVRSQLFVPL